MQIIMTHHLYIYEMITVSLVNIRHHPQLQFVFLVMRACKIDS